MGTDNTLRGIPGKDEEQSSEIRAILPHQSVVNSCEDMINVNNQEGLLLLLAIYYRLVKKYMCLFCTGWFLQLHFNCSKKYRNLQAAI